MNGVEVGVIRFNIKNVSTLSPQTKSPQQMIAELPWKISVSIEQNERTNHKKYLSAFICCNMESESTLWSCDANIELRVLSHLSDIHHSRTFKLNFNSNSNNKGYHSFIEWDKLMLPQNGYVTNDNVTIEAKITVSNVRGVRALPQFDFQENDVNFSDMILVLDGKKLHVSKVYLSLYSPVFQAMFFSDFKERNEEEIMLDDVCEEFSELLRVIYPSRKPIDEKNVEYLLKLGDKYEMKNVINECEKFLISSRNVSAVRKLHLADQYTLAKLQNVCIQRIKTTAEIKNFKTTNEYGLLSDATKSALFEKVLKIV